jgi:acyl carrier protein
MLAEAVRDDIAPIIVTYLSERFPALGRPGADTPLLSSGAIDSLGVLDLMMWLSEEFGIELGDEDFSADNIETPARLTAFVRGRLA